MNAAQSVYALSLVGAGLIVYLAENGEAAWKDYRQWRMARLRRR